MADQADKGPWTIKGVAAEDRKLITACAIKRGETVGVWIGRVSRAAAAVEAGDRVIPPDEREAPRPGSPVSPPSQPVDFAALAAAMQAHLALAQAAGVPIQKALARESGAFLRAQIRAARGLPAVTPGRQTRAQIGHTIEGEVS